MNFNYSKPSYTPKSIFKDYTVNSDSTFFPSQLPLLLIRLFCDRACISCGFTEQNQFKYCMNDIFGTSFPFAAATSCTRLVIESTPAAPSPPPPPPAS